MPISKETPMNEVLVREDFSAANELALVSAQRGSAVRAVAQQLGYQLPMDHIDPDLIQRDIAANLLRTVEACLVVGRGIRVLKEACEHGEFVSRLDGLGIDRHVAARFMQAAVKFSNVPISAHLTKAIGTRSKLLEMIVLDDEQIEELALTGHTGELDLDDVATMSVKELRAAVRKERVETDKQKNQVTRLTTVNTELHEEARLVKRLKPNEALAQIKAEAGVVLDESLGMVRGRLRQALVALNDAVDHPSKATFMAGLVGQMQAEIAALRDEFNLPDAVGDGTPEWERWAQANPIAAAATN